MKKALFLALAILALWAFPLSHVRAAIPTAQRNALIDLYNSTNGAAWTDSANWLGAPGTEDTWAGVTVVSLPVLGDQVTRLELPANNLSGTLPATLGDLQSLTFLSLPDNLITGAIPAELGQLAGLEYLLLSNNAINGALPTELGQLAALIELYLDGNQLTGSIPTQFGQLAALEHLNLSFNSLSGSIPSQLGQLAALKFLYLTGNQFNGALPTELGQLAFLEELFLSGNQLTGSIPTQFGQLAALRLLYLDDNQLTGNIPTQLGQLLNLTECFFSHNLLDGTLPQEMGQLNNLQKLSLAENALTGSIPDAWGNMAALEELDLSDNALSGTLPQALGQLALCRFLKLSGNSFSGSPPDGWGALGALTELWLEHNVLSGALPGTWGSLAALEILKLNGNNLSGPIPDSFGTLGALTPGNSDVDYNGLYTINPMVQAVMDNACGAGWENTQTLAPDNLAATRATSVSIALDWSPLSGTALPGGVEVAWGETAGGPYPNTHTVTDKGVTTATIEGLSPLTTYYMAARAYTNPHGDNQNQVFSAYGPELAQATISDFGGIPPDQAAPVTPPDHGAVNAIPVTLTATPFNQALGDTPELSQWRVRRSGAVYGAAGSEPSFIQEKTAGPFSELVLNLGLVEGMQYFWQMRYFGLGCREFSPWSPEAAFVMGASDWGPDVWVAAGAVVEDYVMVSFPRWPDNPQAAAVFAGQMPGGYDTAQCRFGAYDAELGEGAYVEFDEGLLIQPGRAYWCFALAGLNLRVRGIPVAGLEPIDVPLKYNAGNGNGWNMIACPNGFNYIWDNVQVLIYNPDGTYALAPTEISVLPAGRGVDPRLWRWEGAYAPDTALMEQGNGYWVRALEPGVVLRFPLGAHASAGDRVKTWFYAKARARARDMMDAILGFPAEARALSDDQPPMPMGLAREGANPLDADYDQPEGSCFLKSSMGEGR